MQCPEKEPSVCYYLRVCTDCHHRLRQYQVDMFQTASVADTKTEEFWPELTALEQKIGGIGRKIKTQLPRVGVNRITPHDLIITSLLRQNDVVTSF